MNFLGHALLSNKDEGLLLGNMMGDFIKGRLALAAYPKQVQAGILMHRAIDQFTD
jgi:acyl carrier protein phosphodiesterase